MDPSKKISFGFNKMHLKKTSSKSESKQDNNVQYIQYLDEPVQQSILKSSDHENSDFINVLKKRNLKSVQEIAENKVTESKSTDNDECSYTNDTNRRSLIPSHVQQAEESTIEDYEDVPVSGFGEKMLRQLGWNETSGIGRKRKHVQLVDTVRRAQGVGLGVHVANTKIHGKLDAKNDQKLEIKNGAYIKIMEGEWKYNYGQIQGFLDANRVIAKLANFPETQIIIEDFLKPISFAEFKKQSKIINNAKYEEFVNDEEETKSLNDRRSNQR